MDSDLTKYIQAKIGSKSNAKNLMSKLIQMDQNRLEWTKISQNKLKLQKLKPDFKHFQSMTALIKSKFFIYSSVCLH